MSVTNVINCSYLISFAVSDQLKVAMANLAISDMRKAYKGKQDIFDFSDLVSKEPFEQFYAWLEEAKREDGIKNANAAVLTTATKHGKPSLTKVLMNETKEKKVVFSIDLFSQAALKKVENPMVSLLFYWSSDYGSTSSRQVRIEGFIEQLSEAESTGSASSLVQGMQDLGDKYDDLVKDYNDNDGIPVPQSRGAFQVVPCKFEFWQGQTDRLHDRIVFRKPKVGETIDVNITHMGTDGWVYERLMP